MGSVESFFASATVTRSQPAKASSHELLTTKDSEQLYKKPTPTKPEEKPAVTGIFATETIGPGKKAATGLLKRFLSSLLGAEEVEKSTTIQTPTEIPPKISTQAAQDKQTSIEKKKSSLAPAIVMGDKKGQKPKEAGGSGEAP